MKKIGLFLALLVCIVACDEGGLVITVPSAGSYTFSIKKSEVNADANKSVEVSKAVDPTKLFNEDAELIKGITLNQLTYQVSGYSATGEAENMTLTLSTELDGVLTEIFQVSEIELTNGLFVAYELGESDSQLSSAQVASLEAIIDNQEPFNLIVNASFDGEIDSNFTVNVVWDITASVAQPAN